MDLALRILSDVFCVATGWYISVLRDKIKRKKQFDGSCRGGNKTDDRTNG